MLSPFARLREKYGARVQENEWLSRHTSVRVGGPADALLVVETVDELVEAVVFCWEENVPYILIGGGTNVLVSDAGVRGLVIINRARQIRFDEGGESPTVWAESGVNFGSLARQTCLRGLSGLEWAVGIPGTVGGAVVGNAGAHGQDIAGNLLMAEILHRSYLSGSERVEWMKEAWTVAQMNYTYRSSFLKRSSTRGVVLVVLLRLGYSTPEEIRVKTDAFGSYRRKTQPPGASVGSMFKNPPGDYAGRLIDAAGLKGAAIGDAQISTRHANFFINRGQASAANILALINLAQRTVAEKFAVNLELEIELLGEWNEPGQFSEEELL